MFGWPTGVGCLIARREALAKLERPWFSGGTIVAAFVQREWYQSAPGAAHFEDGTVNFLNLPAVEIGLRLLDRIGIETIHARVEALGAGLLDALGSLRHSDGSPAATIYGPRGFERRGATIAFNFLHPDGRIVDERYVDRVARGHNISLRTGCFCNPGAGEVAFTISRETLVGGEFGDGMTLDDYVARDRPALRWRRPRLARARIQPRGHRKLQRVRTRVRRSRRRTRRPAVTRRLLTANPPRERRCFNRIVIGGRISSRSLPIVVDADLLASRPPSCSRCSGSPSARSGRSSALAAASSSRRSCSCSIRTKSRRR